MANGKVKVKLNGPGVGALLKSPEMAAEVEKHAKQIRARCGSGYETDTYQAGTRVIASVAAQSKEARKDCAENNTLLKAMGGS